MRFKCYRQQAGFTLIEVIISLVVFSISLAVISSLILPAEQNSADQIHQIKASELGQSLMDDILSRAFDNNSDMDGGLLRCNEDQDNSGTVEADEQCSSVLGAENGETSRSLYNDVDDFNDFNLLVDATDVPLEQGYASFQLNVSVVYDGLALGLADNQLAKRIEVVVTTPLGTEIEFTAFKTNY